jgi:archaellum component FlaC
MQINYCDLCDSPLKDDDFYTVYIAYSGQHKNINTTEDYYNTLDKIKKQVKEVCPKYKQIMDEIFRLRRQNLTAISLELLGMYESPVYEKKKKDKK